MNGGRVTGVVVQPRGSGDAFRAAGFAPGDVILSVNGRQVGSAAEARALAEQLGGSEEVTVQVERDGRVIPLLVGPNRRSGSASRFLLRRLRCRRRPLWRNRC